MAKVNGREDALLNAYLNRYQTAQASNVGTGRSTTKKAQQQGSAIMNATDKTLPVLHNSYTETLNNIVQGASLENSLNNDILNRQMKLAQAKFDAANDLYQQQQKAQQYAAKKAAKAAKSSGGSSGKGGSTTGTGSDTESAASLDALFGGGASTSGTTGSTAGSKPKAADTKKDEAKNEKAKEKSAQEKYLEAKKAGARTTAAKSYAERNGTGRVSAAQPAQSRAVTRGWKVIGSSYAAAGSAPSAEETQAAKGKRNDYKSRQEDIAAALKKLQTDADYRAELAAPGRKLTSAEVAAVNQYEKSTKNTGFSGLKRVFETAANKEGLSQEDYAKKTAAMNAELNQNSALRGKAQMNGAGQTAQAFTAGLYDSVPFLTKSVDKLTDIANSTGAELPQLSNAIEGAKSYDPLAAAAGTLVGKGMQYNLFNTAMAGTPLAQTMGKAGNAIVGQAQKIPVLGDVLGAGAGDALGRILTDTTADLALDTLPSLVSDVSEGKSAGEIAGNTAKNIAGNVAMNAVPEIGGALFDRLKGTAGDAAQDALKQAGNDVQDVQSAAPARNIVQPEANGTTGLAAQIQQMNTPDAANRSVLNTLNELRGQVNLNGAQEKEAEQLRRAVLQRQQEIGDETKLALQNTDSLPIDAQGQAGYNGAKAGVVNENLGGNIPANIRVDAESGGGNELQPGSLGNGLSGQAGEGGQGGTESVLGRGVQSNDARNAQSVAEWAQAITGKDRRSPYTRRIESLYSQMQNGASREDLAEEAKSIALGIVRAEDYAEPLDESVPILKDYLKTTPIKVDAQTQGELLNASGLKTLSQYNIQNGTHFSLKDGVDYDTAITEVYDRMGMGNRIPDGNAADALIGLVQQSKAGPLVDTDMRGAVTDYMRDRILDGPGSAPLGGEDFADWLDTQSFDRNAPDYVKRVYERGDAAMPTMNTAPSADAGDAAFLQPTDTASEPVPGLNIAENAQSVAKLNGSESMPENAVGATNARYSTDKIVENKDYANQAATRAVLDDAHREGLTYSKHQVWTDTEAQHQALDDINTYIQEAGGDVDKGLENAMNSLRKDTQWDKGESVTANNIRDRLRTEYMNTEPGTPEFYRQKARYDDWQSEISKQRSKVAQTMQSFTGDATARMHEVSNPIREKWETQHSVEAARIKRLSDELDKLKTAVAQRNLDDMNSQDFTKGVVSGADRFPVQDNVKFPQSIREGMQKAGDMDAEFGQMLKDNGIPTHDERVANFSDADKEKYKTATEEAYNSIVARVKKLCEKNKVNIDDDGVKTIAGKIMNGDNAESYYNSLIMQAAGISDLSIDEMEIVDDLYSTAAKLPDSKERYDLEQQAIAIMAQHLPAADAFEKWDNCRFLAMLGNTTTHARNLLGNIGNMATTSAENKITALLQHTLPKEARTKALYTPAKMKTAAEEYIMNQRYSDLVGKTGTSDLTSSLQAGRKIYGDSIGGKMLQKLTDINSGLLAKEDDIFVKRGMVNSLASNLTAKGLDESIFSATDARSKQILDEAVTQAVRDAAEMTYHIDNAATEMLSKFSRLGDKRGSIGKKIGYCITNGLLPFAKTTANITKTSLTLNPVGAAVEGIYRAGTHKGAAAVMDSAAKGIVGTGLIAFGKWAAEQGYLTGTLDADTKDYDEMTGKQEYSLHIPGVGSYTLDWLAPMAVPVMIGANLKDMSASDVVNTLLTDPTKFAGQVGDILLRAIDPISNMSIVQSANRALDNLKYAGDNGMGATGTLLTNAATSYLQQYVPTMLGKAARTVDPVRRSSYGGGDSYTERNNSYLARSTLNKIPGLSMNNEPYIDQWGREEASLDGADDSAGGMFLRGVYNFGSPGYYSAQNVTPVDEYLQGLYGSTNDSHVYPEKASSKITVDSDDYYMTPEEKTEYAKTSGQTAYDLIDELRQNSMFLQLPEDQQSALVQDAYTVAKTAGGVAAVGDGVSGVNAKEYEAYRDGGAEGFSQYVLMKNATDLVRDEKRETSGNDDATLNTVEKWNTLYSQFGDDAVSNFVNSTDKGSTVRNISDLAGDNAVTAYMQAYSAVAKTLDDDQTPDKFTVGYGMQKYGLSGDDFARAYLAAYYKKDKNGKYPEKGGPYADKAGAEIYQSYGADALRAWVNYRATIPDTNGNGKADKAEAVARLQEMDLTNEMRRAYLAKTNEQWGKKNPF